jgi:hypothetical protein
LWPTLVGLKLPLAGSPGGVCEKARMYEELHTRSLYDQAFGQALAFAEEGLRAERAMVTYAGNGRLYNLDPASLWTTELISLSILKSLIEKAEPRLLVHLEEPDKFEVTSVMITGITSVLFVPIRSRSGEVCGFYYLDNRVHKNGSFQEKDLKQVEAVVAGTLEPILAETGVSRPMTWELLMKTCWI